MKFATLLTPSSVYMSRTPFSRYNKKPNDTKENGNIICTMVKHRETLYGRHTAIRMRKFANAPNISILSCPAKVTYKKLTIKSTILFTVTIIRAALCEMISGIWVQRRPRSACASMQSHQGLCRPLTELLDTSE